MPKNIKSVTAAFSMGFLQDCASLFALLDKEGLSIADLIDHLNDYKGNILSPSDRKLRIESIRRKEMLWEQKAEKCPNCKTPMVLTAGGDDDCHWTCKKCRFGKYVPRPANEVLKDLRISG